MKSPKDMRIIQIDITNACVHRCSNCTRFCGHHKTPFFMDFETFKKAVDSLDGYMGTIGVMGGEPTLHPEFEKIAKYIGSKYPQFRGTDKQMLHPQAEFMKAVQDLEMSHTCGYDSGLGIRQTVVGPGLWSAMGKSYQKHYEVIQDTFKYQALNDHINPMYHQPALITRKELNIPDDEWVLLRDNCWVQNEWSATITPKGAFFCEVAGALDMLFEGPGGWPIEPGWWERTPDEFGDQLHWCEICGLACKTFMRNANDEVDDVSPAMYEKLSVLGSSKLKMGHVNKLKIEDGIIAEQSKASGKRFSLQMPYTENYEARFNSSKTVLFPKEFYAVYFVDEKADANIRKKAYERLDPQFAQIYVCCLDEAAKESWQGIENEKWHLYDMSEVNMIAMLDDIFRDAGNENYIVGISGKLFPKEDFATRLGKYIFNPGVLIYADAAEKNDFINDWIDFENGEEGMLIMINSLASSWQNIRENPQKIRNLYDLKNAWNSEKVLSFDETLIYYPPETDVRENMRYAIYGLGDRAEETYNRIKKGGGEVTCIVDADLKKQGTVFHNLTIYKPEILLKKAACFDKIAIGSMFYYKEIKECILEMGFPEKELTFLL